MAYRPGTWERIREGLRYGGGVGQWSWLAHRLTGLGILLFLIVHIVDTFLVVAYPETYDATVAIYGGMYNSAYYWPLRWAFRLGELGLIASVVFHAANGVRIVLFDFWPRGARHQRALFWGVMVVFWAIMIPVTIAVFAPLTTTPEHWKMPAAEAPAPASGLVAAPSGR
ncbi:MAG TPA: succinate dehydrogenase, cytochrome b556 subunit [Isosphaeraceae bacterium]|jgi:succinate dehydrogenase / fumarate reductase cytochrome b subunit|nr:succinate dehydrogenase, cytochrome b556 subunit [Isosphaeraceae bacterium]